MPKHDSRPPPRHVPPPRRSSRTAVALASAEALEPALVALIPDDEDRAFVARCIASEGPMHHRIASVSLLKLLARALDVAGAAPRDASGDGVAVPFHMPPHLGRRGDEEAHYPLRIPRRAIERLAAPGSAEASAVADALVDGPPHHALANAAMVAMLDALLARLEQRPATSAHVDGGAEGG